MRIASLLQSAAAAAVYAALGRVASRMEVWQAVQHSLPLLIAGAIIATALFLALALLAIAGTVRSELRPWQQALGIVLCAAAWAAARKMGAPIVADVALIIGAGVFGALVSRIVSEKDLLLPVALTAVIVDIWGVYWGFVSEVTETAPQVAASLSAAVPVAAKEMVPLAVLGSVGIGDFAFAGLFLSAVWRFRLEWRLTLAYMVLAVSIGPILLMGVAAFLGYGLDMLPGLPFIALAVVIASRKHFQLSRATKFALLYTVLLICGIIGAYTAGRALLG